MMHNCPINCLFSTELSLGSGTIPQSFSQRRDILLSSQPSSLSVLHLPPCPCLCTEAESRSLITIISVRDGVIISQVPLPRQNCKEGVLCYHDDHIKLVKVRPVKPKTFILILFFFLLLLYDRPDMLIYQWQV